MVSISHANTAQPVPALFRAKVRAIWRFLLTQPASFWLVNFYLFLEYVRPQSIYRWLDILPWAQTTLILATVALLLEGKLPRLRTSAGPWLMSFAVIVALSSFMAISPSASFAKWELFYSWILIYLLITNTVTTEKRFFVFFLAFLLYSFKMSQHGFRTWMLGGFGFSSWGASGAPGWFQNSGEFGIQMCIFLPLVVEFIIALRHHWSKLTRWFFYLLPVTAVASIVASSSRGALVGGAAVAVWWIARSKVSLKALVAVAVLGAATWAVVPPEQKARFAEAGEDDTSIARMDRWKAGIRLANQYPILGIGYENWGAYYGGWLSHNVFIQAWAELGYTGLGALLALIAITFWINHRTRKMLKSVRTSTSFMHHAAHGLDGALIGFMGSGFFVTVLYYPFFWINLAMTVSLHVAATSEARRLGKQGRPPVRRRRVTRPPPPVWPVPGPAPTP